MVERYELQANEKDILNGKIKILEIKDLPEPKYRVIPRNIRKVNRIVKPGIKIVEEGEIDHVEVEYA